jgi:hypothetical protein
VDGAPHPDRRPDDAPARASGKAGYVLVLIMPNNPVSLLAGPHACDPVVLDAQRRRTIGRLLLMWWIGLIFQEWIDAARLHHGARIQLLVVTVGLVLLSGARDGAAARPRSSS